MGAGACCGNNRAAMTYTEDDIRRHVGARALEAGRHYLREGRVDAFFREGDLIAAQVKGTARRPYLLSVQCSSDAGDFESECSCPVGGACKHVAAALLKGLREQREPARPAPAHPSPPAVDPAPRVAELPPALASWLGALDAVRAEEERDYPASVSKRIVYVLSPDARAAEAVPHLAVQAMTARLRKDGSFAPDARRFEPHAAFRPGARPLYLRHADLRILHKMSAPLRVPGAAYFSSPLTAEDGFALLEEILATGRARWLGVDGAALALGPPRPGALIWATNAAAEARLRVDVDGLALNAEQPVYVDVQAGLVGPVALGVAPRLARVLLAAPPAPLFHAATVRERLAKAAPGLPPPPVPVNATPRRWTGTPQIAVRLLRADLPPPHAYGWGAVRTESVGAARLLFRYGEAEVEHGAPAAPLLRYHDGELIEARRDARLERAAVAQLTAMGLRTVPASGRGGAGRHAFDFLPGEGGDEDWFDVLHRDVPALKALGWSVEIDADFPIRLVSATGGFAAALRESAGLDWLDLDLGVVVDGETIDLVEPLVRLIAAGAAPLDAGLTQDADAALYLPLADGRILALPMARLAPILAALDELTGSGALTGGGGALRLSRADAAGLAAFERATKDVGVTWRGGERLREMGRRLTESGGLPRVATPPDFCAQLRPYQQQGVDWLAFLAASGLGGVLADDMGLGKTVQALALIAIEKAAGRLSSPTLVVAPTSLMANWRTEAEKFAPTLKVLTLHGSDRKSRFEEIEAADVVLTTYPLIARDHETIAARPWGLVVLDEAQTIKNPNAATTKLIHGLKAPRRFCLTGTPLENHLGEAWSVMSFAMPGLLGDLAGFNRAFRTPIEKKGDAARSRVLARRIAPFLLRRTKDEVARDLPPKTEIVERIDMTVGQRNIYEAIRLSMHEKVRAAIAAKGFVRSRIVILDALPGNPPSARPASLRSRRTAPRRCARRLAPA